MTTTQLINGFLLAASLILASFTPGRELRGAVMSGLAVAISWGLVIWSYHGGLWAPAFILTDISRDSVSPYAVWATQDATLTFWLGTIYWFGRSRIVAIVGLVFAAQVAFHVMEKLGLAEPLYLSWLEILFYAQLVAIGALGGGEIGQRVVDWLSHSRFRNMGHSGSSAVRMDARKDHDSRSGVNASEWAPGDWAANDRS